MCIYNKHNKQAVNIKRIYSHLTVWLTLQKNKQTKKHHWNKKPTPLQW